MKKLYITLCAVLFTFNANAFDVAGSLNKVSAAADNAAQKVEAQKAADKAAKENATAAVEAQKNEVKDAVEAKKAEIEAKAAENQAASDAKKAEQKKAIEDTKDSLNNLKNAFSK